MSKYVTMEQDENKLEYLKYRLDMRYKIIKLSVSSLLIAICGIISNYYVFTLMTEQINLIYGTIAINAIVVLLLLGVSVENILTLIGKAKLIKTNGVGIPKDEDSP